MSSYWPRAHTWAGGSQHGQGLLRVGLSSEPPHKLPLALEEAEVPREGGVKHVVCAYEGVPTSASEGQLRLGWAGITGRTGGGRPASCL